MDIRVGAYSLNGDFKSKKQAKEVFLTHFPAVTEKDLDTELGKLFKDGIDKSDNTEETFSESDSANTEVDNGGTEKKSSGRNKPR